MTWTATRRELDLIASPGDVLRSLRGTPGLVALVGAWAGGSVIISCDPLVESSDGAFSGAHDVDPADAVANPSDLFGGGWIGAWGYQLGTDIEDVGAAPTRPIPLPPVRAGFYDRVLRHVDGRWWLERITGLMDPSTECDRDERLLELAGRPARPQAWTFAPFEWQPNPEAHVAAIRRTQREIAKGEIFQANIAVRLESTLQGDLLDAFCSGLDGLAPRYGAYLADRYGSVASFSPELFLRREGRAVVSSPVKGTAPLREGAVTLTSSIKEIAENVMIVDLVRNDLARVCRPGSVRVDALGRVDSGSVHQLVSDVSGRLRDDICDSQLLRATFPPGSVTGAPKIRAMHIIHDTETTARETYTGALGYISPFAGLEMNVAIRTVECAQGQAWMGVGGAITALSDPWREVAECVTKALPVLRAVRADLARPLPTVWTEKPRVGLADDLRSVAVRRPRVPSNGSFRVPRQADGHPRKVLVLDNYDSFVFNLVHDLESLGADSVEVVRSDRISMEDLARHVRAGDVSHLLLSPGPGSPTSAGIMLEAITTLGPLIPILGVCLGHQAIGEAYGGRCMRAESAVHGRSSLIHLDGRGLLQGLPEMVHGGRYHSLVLDPAQIPDELEVTARSGAVVMGVRHRHHQVEGVQWHPESVLTEQGHRLLATFLEQRGSGRSDARELAASS